MTAEADQLGPAMVSLPGVPAYLRSVYELGRRSLRPALPALALLFLYGLGVGAYVALRDYSLPQGRAALVANAADIASPLLFLVLIYAPFLALQESLLRGRPLHFLGAIRRVLQVSVIFMLSAIAQVLVLLLPVALISVLMALLPRSPHWTLLWIYLAPIFWTYFAWILVAAFFMIFAMPAVVLDGEGPLYSLQTSFHLVSRNFGSALGRLLVLAFLATVAYKVATIPSSILGAAGRTPGVAAAAIKLAAVIWTSAADTLFFPFLVAGIMVLYRSLRPWTDEESVRVQTSTAARVSGGTVERKRASDYPQDLLDLFDKYVHGVIYESVSGRIRASRFRGRARGQRTPSQSWH